MIKFIDESHRYIDESGNDLISVSKFFKKFQPFVDWDKIASKFADKQTKLGNPMTKDQVRTLWKNKADTSSSIGTLFHSIKEKEILDEINPSFYNVVCNKKTCPTIGNEKFSIPINNIENNTIYLELMIYDLDNMICGQSDKVIVVKNKINIWDYKTDKEILFKGYSSEWVPVRKLLKPLDHLDDCNGNHYAIKMSMYMYLLWKANKGRFKPGELILEHVHLQRDEDGVPILDEKGKPVCLKIKKIKIPYLKKEVEEMLKYNKNE